MSDVQKHDGKSLEKCKADVEEGILVISSEDIDSTLRNTPQAVAQASGDRVLMLMDLDNGLVGWEGDDDIENPQNWTWGKKWMLMTWVILMTTFSSTVSSLYAPSTELVMEEFGVTSKSVGTFMTSIYVIGYAVGPLFLAPLSEVYGRPIVINFSAIVFNAFLLGCSFAPNMPSLIIMRLFAGIGGSAAVTIVSACIGDVYMVHERAAASAIVLGAPALSLIVGPILGGFISQKLGLRWAYWVMVMAAIPLNILMILFMQESNHPTILEKKTQCLRKSLGRDDLHSRLELQLPPHKILARSLVRPVKFICKSPIILMIALYVSTVYGILYLMLTTIPNVFEDIYHFEIQHTGLAYSGLGVGMFMALVLIIMYSDRTVMRLRGKNGGKFEPEMRLANCIYFAPFIPVSLFIYAWTTRASTHWIIPCLSLIPFGFGILAIFVLCQTYAVDAFLETAASAVAALVVMRSIFGALLPLVGPVVYDALGLGMGNTLLGILALLVTPVPFAFLEWGGDIRRRWPVKL